MIEFIATVLIMGATALLVTTCWLMLNARLDRNGYTYKKPKISAEDWAQRMGEEPEDCWSFLPDQRGQAMPAFIVPVAVCVLGLVLFGVVALLVRFL